MTQKSLKKKRKFRNEYMKQWRKKNPEKAFDSPEWRKLKPERAKENDKRKRELNREYRINYAQKYNPNYYESNKDKLNKNSKLWYEENKEKWLDHVKRYREENLELISNRRKVSRVEINEYLKVFKSNKGCAKCKESDPVCLEFHHKDKKLKKKAIATMISKNFSHKKILLEVKKCTILCSNCHKKEHYRNGLLG